MTEKYADLTLSLGLAMGDRDQMRLQRKLQSRIQGIKPEHDLFADECKRMDGLFYSTTFTQFGADIWSDDPNLLIDGRSHVSLNNPQVYVEVPASLQAVEPIENMVAIEDSEEGRDDANALERVRESWKVDEQWQLKRHKAATVKGLYGRTASFVYPDKEKDYACADVVINPRNLYMGFKDDNYAELEWAAQVTLLDPNAAMERYSIEVSARATADGTIVPWVVGAVEAVGADIPREMNWGPARVEVWDYWYRKMGKPGKRGQQAKMETWNCIVVGNEIVRDVKYSYYDGVIPYVPLFNTFIPGVPTGRAELHDMEQLIREKMARITAGAQMIQKATAGDYWQVFGENAPARGIANVKPMLNQTVSAGPGNRFEAIAPFIAEFQLEQFLGRLDREMAIISGLNDLLLGLAPSAVLNSSKAINALVANYESRLAMRRLLFYEWDRKTWELVTKVWSNMKNSKSAGFIKDVLKRGLPKLDIIDPSLSPRDEMETSQRAANLVGAKLWSQARGMDAVGVDDPEQEQNIIRRESTDATLWPDRVNLMVQLMSALNAAQAQMPQGAGEQVAGQQASGAAALQDALGVGTPGQTPGQQEPFEQGITPQVAGADNSPFAQGPRGAEGIGAQPMQVQSMIQGGKLSGRILNNTKYGRR